MDELKVRNELRILRSRSEGWTGRTDTACQLKRSESPELLSEWAIRSTDYIASLARYVQVRRQLCHRRLRKILSCPTSYLICRLV